MNKKYFVTITVLIFVSLTFFLLVSPGVKEERSYKPRENNKVVKGNKKEFSQRKSLIKGYSKKDNPRAFFEFHREIRTADDELQPGYKVNYKITELTKAVRYSRSLKKFTPLNWIERGPGNVGGRTRGIAVDPDDLSLNTWYAGSVSGGVWKTTNAGQSWIDLTFELPNLATSTIAVAQSNPNIIYVGTGEGFGNIDQIDGSGIWKSSDKGNSWVQLQSTSDKTQFQNITRLIVNPSDENNVVVSATPGGNISSNESAIFITTDGGISWNKSYSNLSSVEQIIANPKNFNTQYATVNGTSVIKSFDGGITWAEYSNGLPIEDLNRMEIAISPTDTNRLYLSCQSFEAGSKLFITTNGGNDWYQGNDENNYDWLQQQGWYDNTIAVHPFDKNIVYVGGINLWKMEIDESIQSENLVVSTEINNLYDFWEFVNADGDFDDGGFIGENFLGSTDITPEDYSSVEVRFGPGRNQKAHRFFREEDDNYIYRDYVTVPFEVWDTDHNRQLMISFRDYEDNGIFDFQESSLLNDEIDREYIFISSVNYNSTSNPNIAAENGMLYKNIFSLWATAPEGAGNIDFNSVPTSSYKIVWGTKYYFDITVNHLTDSYRDFDGLNEHVHVDHHNLTLVPMNIQSQTFRLINGNDGGIWYSDDGGETFTGTLNAYNTSQFYGVDKANNHDAYIGGTQDNGSFISPENPERITGWYQAPSGDGFEAVWNYHDTNKLMESSQFNSIYRTTDLANNWSHSLTHGLSDYGSGNAPFFTKLADSKQDPDLVFAVGKSGVWRTDDFGNSWTVIPITHSGWDGTSSFTQVKISLADPQYVWTGSRLNNSTPLLLSTDGGLTFNQSGLFTERNMGRLTGFATHPVDPNTAYALFSFSGYPKILKTTNLGQSWNDISGYGSASTSSNGFPDVAVYCLLVMPYNTDIIWVGTEIGLFISTNGGATWSYSDNGIPAVGIWDMVIVNNEVVAATHGRGVWTVELPELNEYEPLQITRSPRLLGLTQGVSGANILINLPDLYDSSVVLVNENVFMRYGNLAQGDISLIYPVQGQMDISAQVISYKNSRIYKSVRQEKNIIQLAEIVNSYESNFNERRDDFMGEGFSITNTVSGFSDYAIHTAHPYADVTELQYVLKYPIRVASMNATIKYKDIALVEPGDEGSTYGQSGFYDYVVLEASKDGVNWLPLKDGYDCRYNSDWLNTYINNSMVDESLFIEHNINMLDTFSPGDEIILRFRLLADASVNGWGWAIKDIKIQENNTSVDESSSIPVRYTLNQNYPNPFNPVTTIKFDLPETGKVSLQVFNLLGEVVATLVNEELNAGRYSYQFNGTGLASGIYFYRMKSAQFSDVKKLILLK